MEKPNQIVATDRQRALCRPHGLLFGHDVAIAEWTWNEFKVRRMHVDAAIGVVRKSILVGSAIFQNFTGHNVELSYYAPETLSAGIIRTLAQYTITRFNVDRLTVRTNRKNVSMIRVLPKLGFKFEGVQRRYYGSFGDAAIFVLFREDLERMARSAEGKDETK